jgi:uncharacterized protein YecT (DUF1311 family)
VGPVKVAGQQKLIVLNRTQMATSLLNLQLVDVMGLRAFFAAPSNTATLRRSLAILGLVIGGVATGSPAQAQANIDAVLRSLMQSFVPNGQDRQPAHAPPPYYSSPPPVPPVRPREAPARVNQATPPAAQLPSRPGTVSTEQPSGPSFSCARASRPAEHAICRDPGLASLDRTVSSTYAEQRATASGDDLAVLVAEQRAWVAKRDACQSNVRCLREAMTQRVGELRVATAVPAGAGFSATQGPASPTGSPSVLGSAPNVAGDDPLRRLVAPPVGLRPWRFASFEGRLAVTFLGERLPGDDEFDVQIARRFFHLLAAGHIPGLLEDGMTPSLISQFVSDQAYRELFGVPRRQDSSPSQWGGKNEIEVESSRQRFREHYLPLIRDLAPKPTFVLRWLQKANLGLYDAARGGFPVTVPDGPAFLTAARQAKLRVAPGIVLPEIFWPADRDAAQAFLRRWPDRSVELGMDLEVSVVDPDVGEISFKPTRVRLLARGRTETLLELPLQLGAAASQEPVRPAPMPSEQVVPPGVDAALANAAEAARRWQLPTMRGLPYSDIGPARDVGTSGGLGFGNDFGVNPASDLRPLAPGELWARAMRATALATLPDPVKAISDNDAVAFACIFLPRARQVQIFKQPACGSDIMRANFVFQRRDGASAFRREDLPRLLADAPRVPLRILLVAQIPITGYNEALGGFPIGNASAGAPTVFGSPLDIRLPTLWPPSETQARALVSGTRRDNVPQIWLAITTTILGPTAEGRALEMYHSSTGLPNSAGWRFRTDSVILYQDAALRTPLHDFTPSIIRMAQPILGTAEEQAPARGGFTPLTGEAALLLALRHGMASELAIDWSSAAASRIYYESKYRTSADWPLYDRWGTFYPAESGAEASRYQAWTQRRSEALPDTFSLSRSLDRPVLGANNARIAVYGNTPGVFAFEQSTPVNLDVDSARRLLARGIEAAQLLPMQLEVPGTQKMPVYLALPKPTAGYVVQFDAPVPPDVIGQPRPLLLIQHEVAGLELMNLGSSGGTRRPSLVVRLVPKSAEIRRGASLVSSSPLEGGQWSPPPPLLPGVEQRLAGGAYGPDIIGVRLGMSMAEAEAIIRSNLQVSRVLETTALAS